jgi:prepilin-type processing-associated H-X9-DG protein
MSKVRRNYGGRAIDVITIAIVLGLVGMGVWWVIKTTGQAGQQYAEAMVKTNQKALNITCQSNMQTIFQNLHIYAVSNEHFPESQTELTEFSGYTKLFHCSDPNGSQYVYIPGQSGDMSPTNVLVYETKPVHDGRCNVLFLGGQIEGLTPEQLKLAVEATLAHLHRR